MKNNCISVGNSGILLIGYGWTSGEVLFDNYISTSDDDPY